MSYRKNFDKISKGFKSFGFSVGSLGFTDHGIISYKSNIEYLVKDKLMTFISAINKNDDI